MVILTCWHVLMGRIWKEFSPRGRENDKLVLRHWVKKGSHEDENGSFASR